MSRIGLGSVMFDPIDHRFLAHLFDLFFFTRGNCTRHSLGLPERGCGKVCWGVESESRIREEIVLIGKGAATARCTPKWLLRESSIVRAPANRFT